MNLTNYDAEHVYLTDPEVGTLALAVEWIERKA